MEFAEIRKDWPNQRCNPQVIPFAGLINRSPDEGILESTADNFSNCTTTILTEITGDFLTPLYSVTSFLKSMVTTVINDVDIIRNKIGSIGDNIKSIDRQIMGRIMNFLMPIKVFFMKFRDMLATNATIVGGIHIHRNLFKFRSFFEAFITIMLIGMAFALATGGALAAGLFTAPLAPPFFIIAAAIAAVIVFVLLVEHKI